mmetsp:Transcript_81256/g.228884  ORF Transcript_81256/g.228884 Transcript_81256/m.228884 type:complete len:226 (-) Transcript_81256:649-1326(-)
MSSASSLFSVVMTLSIITSTFSKWPTLASRTCTAKAASLRLFPLVAELLSTEYAFDIGESAPSNCRKTGAMSRPVLYLMSAPVSLPSLMAEPKSSRAASLVRISSALPMPANSSSRRLLRVLQSSCLDWHAALVSSKKAMSAFFCSAVSSYMACVSARRCSDSALVPSFSILSFSSASTSSAFVAMKSSKLAFAVASACVEDSKSEVKVSYMSLRMPCTVMDCGA